MYSIADHSLFLLTNALMLPEQSSTRRRTAVDLGSLTRKYQHLTILRFTLASQQLNSDLTAAFISLCEDKKELSYKISVNVLAFSSYF